MADPQYRLKHMSFVYQIGREALRERIQKNASHLRGRCLDVGSQGSVSRYRELLTHIDSYTSLDVEAQYGADITASAEHIPVPDDSFDSILCSQVLDDVPHPGAALKEFSRVLKKDGTLLLTVPVITLIAEADLWRFTPRGLRLLLEEAGFDVVVENHIGGFFTVRNQFLVRYIKNALNLPRRGRILRGICNKLFLAYGAISSWLDGIFPSKGKYLMHAVVVARNRKSH